jgi:hypothetical protein
VVRLACRSIRLGACNHGLGRGLEAYMMYKMIPSQGIVEVPIQQVYIKESVEQVVTSA